MELYQYVIAIIGGLVAGVINTLAGNGSAITLTILTEVLGLPPNVANGSNRVGIIFQSWSSTYAFNKGGKLPVKKSLKFVIPSVIGALFGVWVAVNVSNEAFKEVFKYLMIALLFVILIKPKRWLQPTDSEAKHSLVWIIPLYLALGFYGGFIQMGMGIFFLASMVLLAKFDLVEGNAVKVFVVACYTIFVLGIFAYRGLVDWQAGGLIAIGQFTGAYFTAKYASEYPNLNVWVYRILVAVVIFAIVKLFSLHTLLWDLLQ